MTRKILVVDDKASMRDMLKMAFEMRDMQVILAGDGEAALRAIDAENPDVVVSDLKMPKLDGMGLLREIAKRDNPPAFLMITAHGSVKDAVEAMALGAADFVEKPFDLEELEFKVDRAMQEAAPEAATETGSVLPNMVGNSARLSEVADIVRRSATSSVPVLILGESGTGKELVARSVHELSERKDAPFVAVHAGAFNEGVLESELFGHEKGAFTGADQQREGRFEAAKGGTLFLDELGEIPLATQVKLLRVLQERTFERVGGSETLMADVRLVCATNRNLRELVAEGKFREDLFYRVNVVTVSMPPLRERMDDLPDLVRHFLSLEKSDQSMPSGIMDEFQRWHWPGNVRELQNVVRRLVALSGDEPFRKADLPDEMKEMAALPPGEEPAAGLVGDVERMERASIVAALKETGFNITRAARVLGIGRTGLQYKLKKYGIERP